MGYWKLVVAVD